MQSDLDESESGNRSASDPVLSLVHMLRTFRHMPLSFIQANDRVEVIPPDLGDDVELTLTTLVEFAPTYRWLEISGHYVLYAREGLWERQISGIQIVNMPRLKAATQFVVRLREIVPELGDLSEPPMMGDPRSSVYVEPVSLSSGGTILQHLAALLGSEPRTIFTIERTRFGDRVLHFDRVTDKDSLRK